MNVFVVVKKLNKWCIGEKRINALLDRKDEKDFGLHNKMQSKVLLVLQFVSCIFKMEGYVFILRFTANE